MKPSTRYSGHAEAVHAWNRAAGRPNTAGDRRLIAVGTGRPAVIAAEIGLSRPATSRQLRILTVAGLIRWTRSPIDRRGRLYLVAPTMEGPIIAWLAGVEVGRQASWRTIDGPT